MEAASRPKRAVAPEKQMTGSGDRPAICYLSLGTAAFASRLLLLPTLGIHATFDIPTVDS